MTALKATPHDKKLDIFHNENRLILASQSPRRKELLTQLGFAYTNTVSDIDETVLPQELPHDYVLRLAEQKAQHVFNALTAEQQAITFVLGSDTSVIFADKILGKPDSEQHCLEMLSMLSNNQHQVLTAIALVSKGKVSSQVVSTTVCFKALTAAEISAYWHTGEPQDKAGAYGIQGIAGQFVTEIKGSYSAVVGLPLCETANLLHNVGFVGAIDKTNTSN